MWDIIKGIKEWFGNQKELDEQSNVDYLVGGRHNPKWVYWKNIRADKSFRFDENTWYQVKLPFIYKYEDGSVGELDDYTYSIVKQGYVLNKMLLDKGTK